MSDWREKALELLPELEEELTRSDNSYSFWHEIWPSFEWAYREPRNESLIKRVYMYASRCCAQERGEDASDDLLTCVVVCFYEHIPTCLAARADLPRWFDRATVILMKDTFSYFLDEGEFKELIALFDNRAKFQPKTKRTAKKRKK